MERDEDRADEQGNGERPSDTERLVGDTPASEPLTTAPRVQPPERESREGDAPPPAGSVRTDRDAEREAELGHS